MNPCLHISKQLETNGTLPEGIENKRYTKEQIWKSLFFGNVILNKQLKRPHVSTLGRFSRKKCSKLKLNYQGKRRFVFLLLWTHKSFCYSASRNGRLATRTLLRRPCRATLREFAAIVKSKQVRPPSFLSCWKTNEPIPMANNQFIQEGLNHYWFDHSKSFTIAPLVITLERSPWNWRFCEIMTDHL